MRDRLSTKILSNGATRYGVYDETGNLLRYEYIKLEDEPTVEGDLFSKANMLPDSIPALLGLKMANPQVKDALNVLANVGNLHVWKRVQTYSEPVPEVPAGYTLGAVETDVLLVSKAGETSVSISYSDSISVDANGNVSLASVNTISYVISEWREHYSVLQGKFCQVMDSTSGGITDAGASIFFFPSDAILEYAQAANYKLTLTAKKYQSVTGYPYTPAIPAGTTTDYLTSTDRNAYPDKSAAGGQDAYYTLGDVVSGSLSLYEYTTSKNYVNWDIASDLSISDDGTVSLVSPTSVSISPTSYTNANSMLGKYIQLKDDAYAMYTTITPGSVFYIPSDAGVSSGSPGGVNKVWLTKYQPVTGHAAIPANTTITYLGQLGGGARIEVGSYVGTGTYGSKSANSLTADFPIKLCIVGNYKSGSTDCSATAIFMPFGCNTSFKTHGYFYSDYDSAMQDQYKNSKVSSDGKTLTWYDSRSAQEQLNVSSRIYYYVLIG